MAETNPQDRLQPFLLDRLADDEPKVSSERAERRAMTAKRYRESVMRDLAWLLNAKSQTPASSVHSFEEARKSVLNFGMPDLTGLTASSVTPIDIERLVRAAILQFEPRIVRHTLMVKAVESGLGDVQMSLANGNVIGLEIKGDIRLLPLPEPIFVRTKVDLETGHVELTS
jgi:type VI secretion system protein ImpF